MVNEEKELKRFIKKKLSYSLSLMVKFLITGALGLSLTACGGGGGGSSSGGGNTPNVRPENGESSINIPDRKPDTTGYKNYNGNELKIGKEFNGNEWKVTKGTLTGKNVSDKKGIKAVKTNLVSDADINLQGNKLVGINAKKSKVVSNGNITIQGDKSAGIESSDSTIVNNGNIKIDGNKFSRISPGPIMNVLSSVYSRVVSNPGSFGIGIYSEISKKSSERGNKFTILNTGDIEVGPVSEGYGIYSGVEGVEIDFGEEVDEEPNTKIKGADVINEGNITVNIKSVKCTDPDNVLEPYFEGEGAGIYVENANIINDGKITVNGDFTCVNGIQLEAYNPSIDYFIKNSKNGVIIVDGTDGDKVQDFSGIKVFIDELNEENIKGKIINEGKIELIGGKENLGVGVDALTLDMENSGEIRLVNVMGSGISGRGSKIINTEDGKIIGINGDFEGMISLFGDNNTGINKGLISTKKVNKNNKLSIGMSTIAKYTENAKLINDKTGRIIMNQDCSIGMKGILDNYLFEEEKGMVELSNKGKIELTGRQIIGIDGSGKNTFAFNEGIIKLKNTKQGLTIGMFGKSGAKLINKKEGVIIATGKETIGMFADGGTAKNYGVIKATNGMKASSNSTIINEKCGTITVVGNGACGMFAVNNNAIAINNGIINVGAGAEAGMTAMFNGAKAINKGTINVGKNAKAGMIARCKGTIDNQGTINVDKSHEAGFEAMQTESDGTIKNKGTINTNQTVVINTKSTYAVGLSADGNHGQLMASNFIVKNGATLAVEMTPEAKLSTETREVVVADAENKQVEEGVNFATNSILHSATEVETNSGKEVVEVKKVAKLADFADKNTKGIARVLDKKIENGETKELVTFAKTLSSVEATKAGINKMGGAEYHNVSRQMLNIDNTFRKYDASLISTLGTYDYNFEFIGEFSKDDSKNGINGYENNMTGFNGGVKFAKDLYGIIGYGHSDIDYKDSSSTEKIQTIHAGLYQDNKIDEYNLRIGVLGEYNFHKMDRENIADINKTKFESYTVGANVEVSRRFGTEIYLEPKLGLNASYGRRDAIDESKILSIEEEDYASVKPEVGVRAGRIFNNVEVYANAKYSYEFGDIDKDLQVKLLGDKTKIKNNEMEEGTFDVAAGINANFNQIDLSLEVGKEFKDVDRNYVKAGISYSF